MIATTVHTTGVNWDGVIANVGGITVVLVALFGLLARVMKTQLKEAVTTQVAPLFAEIQSQLQQIRSDVDSHSTAIARLEGFQEGRTMYQKTLDQSRRQANDIINDPE